MRINLYNFFKRNFLQMVGIISIIDTLWNFIERIFKVINCIIVYVFDLSVHIPPPINSDSSKKSEQDKSAIPTLHNRLRKEQLEKRFSAIGEAPDTNKRTRQ